MPAEGVRAELAREFDCTPNRVGQIAVRYRKQLGLDSAGSGYSYDWTDERVELLRRVIVLTNIFGPQHSVERFMIGDWVSGEPIEYRHHGYVLTVHMTKEEPDGEQ